MGLFEKCLVNPLRLLAALFMLAASGAPVLADTHHVPVGSWVYPALERLEAEGLLSSGVLTNRPINRDVAASLVSEAEGRSHSKTAGRIIEKLKKEFATELSGAQRNYLRPFDEATLKYLYAEGVPHLFNVNNKGDEVGNGSNFRLGFDAAAGLGGLLSVYLNPEARYPDGMGGDNGDVVLVEGVAALQSLNVELTAGRQALWWGPGHHGSLLLSDNARPFDLIKLTNPRPTVLPWVLKYLGPVKLTAFVTELEDERFIPSPYLAGLRLDIRPHRYVSAGFARTAIFGGAGRNVDASVVWDIITAQSENNFAEEPGNQLGSVDLKVILPFDFQKVVLYGEIGGEDEAGSLPSRVAYLFGAYLPAAFGVDRLDLRFEYGETYIGKYPDLWYNHHLYQSGYTYYGRVIGHHMGTDAKDLFASAVYYSDIGDFQATVDLEKSGRGVKRRTRSAQLSWSSALGDAYELALAYEYDRRTAENGTVEGDGYAHSVMGSVKMDF